MPGYEELTPGQIMTIMYIILACAFCYVIARVGSAYFNYRASKNISFHLKREVGKSIAKELNRKPFIIRVKEWLVERKRRKEERLLN